MSSGHLCFWLMFPLCKQIDGPAKLFCREHTVSLMVHKSLFQRKKKKNLAMKNKAKVRIINLFIVKRDRMKEGKYNQHY